MKVIPASELIINDDGSVFHLHLRPQELADTVLLVGDPGRVGTIAAYFDTLEHQSASREFVSATGTCKGLRITALSTGIGTDNIDIVLNELDALANIDFATRTVKPQHRSLRIVRIGTSGALHADIPLGACIISNVSAGIDGLLNFYGHSDRVCDLQMQQAFIEHTRWPEPMARPYFVKNDPGLVARFHDMGLEGITFSAPGFYAPQGRSLRLPLAMEDYVDRIASFRYQGLPAANFEMESSAIAGLSALLGHRAVTLCAVIAQRAVKDMNVDYQQVIRRLIEDTLERLTAVE